MIYREKIEVNNKDFIDKLLSYQPKSKDDVLIEEDDRYTKTVRFSNGYSMDIRICGIYYVNGEDNRPWYEAALFDEERVEITCTTNQLDIVYKGKKFYNEWSSDCTGLDGKFYGEWRLEDGDDTYIIDVQ